MRETVSILGVPIDNVTNNQALEKLTQYLKEEKNHIVITPNPEQVMEAQKDPEFMEILRKADLLIPDGIGIVLASRLCATKLKERVTGCDLIFSLFDQIKDTPHTVYLLGAADSTAEKAKAAMEKKFPNLKIIGTHNGYFDQKEEKIIIKEIQDKKPDVLLVGIGFPKQEKWMYRHRFRLPVKISMGIGGSIDIMAGTVKRAPDIFIRFGLEWLFRLLSEPRRIGRTMRLPAFALLVIKEKILGRM